ncbi:M3 family metallopeptidase [Robbsia betulipollinis]|nr:M3 family metallopeptidase [Robbsia betulipollinis]
MSPVPSNPLFAEWPAPYGLPPFAALHIDHFEPAFETALAQHMRELDAIAAQAAPPDFDNTIAAFDRAGRMAQRLELLLDNLASSETSPPLQEVERRLASRLAAHRNAIYLHAPLFARIDAVRREAGDLSPIQRRLLERLHLDFVRAGALLENADRERYAANAETLATLHIRFGQNVLADEAAFLLPLDTPEDFAGLPESLIAATREAALERGLAAGRHVLTLSPSMVEPFLSFSSNRALRERVWRARSERGAHPGEHDNRPVAAQIVGLRQEQAALHGYPSYAHYVLTDRMARTPEAVDALLMRAWQPALQQADRDRADLEDLARQLGEPLPIAAWDWPYLAEKIRAERYALDDAVVKPYFSLDAMIGAMFDCATRLFGVHFVEIANPTLYHPDARLWEVRDAQAQPVGLFIGDNYARPTKRSGAWMHIFRSQSGIDGGTLPIVINNNNFAKASPTLLSFDDVQTLFHEFGHGLHGLLSQVPYERLAGTSVLRDFVELPSQIFENWALEPEVLRRHARHVETGEPLPEALIERCVRARQFDQGWQTLQYVAPALIDMALHALPAGTPVDIEQFEQTQRARLGVPADVGLRHRLPHFQHLFSGDGYAAGYYVYMWAEVLDADGYLAFTEAGDPFDPEAARRLHRHIYGAGNGQDPAQAYRDFRGRDPRPEAMLARRGLLPVAA